MSQRREERELLPPASVLLELSYRNRGLCNVYGIVQSKNLQPGAASLGLDLQGGLEGLKKPGFDSQLLMTPEGIFPIATFHRPPLIPGVAHLAA